MTNYLKNALFFLLLIRTNVSFAQDKISKKDQAEIKSVCEIYIRQTALTLIDFDAPMDSILSICSESLATFNRERRSFYQKMEFDFGEIPIDQVIKLELKDLIGCIANGDPEYKINLEKIGNRWIVVGFNNEVIDQETVNLFRAHVEEEAHLDLVRDSISEILTQFVDGWSEMRMTQKSSLLKAVTTDDFYQYILKDALYEHMQGFRRHPISIKEMERISFDQDTAWCRMEIKGLGGSRFPILFRNGKWLVAGADHRVFQPGDAAIIDERIALFQENQKFEKRMEHFNENIEGFLRRGDRSLLTEIATTNLIDELEIYRRLFGTVDTNLIGARGLRSSSWANDIHFSENPDTAYTNSIYDSIQWVKIDGRWLMDDIFPSVKRTNIFEKALETYNLMRQALFITYSFYNSSNYENSKEVVVATQARDIEIEPIDYYRIDYHAPEIDYFTGNEQLYRDLIKATANRKKPTDFIGTIYVEFQIDHLGKASNFKALDNLGTPEAAIAEEIARNLGDWKPSDDSQPWRINMVVPVEF